MRALRRSIGVAATVALLATIFVHAESSKAASSFSFALIGDVPYSSSDISRMGSLIAQINNATSVEFVAHAGDIKAASDPCSDSLITGRFNTFQQFADPFWYTPGDNEWTDCTKSGDPLYRLDRLAFVRSLFYPDPNRTTGRSTMPVTPQSSSYPENVRFRRECVTFGSIHQVGSSNGLSGISGDEFENELQRAEVENRITANATWVDQIFDRAAIDMSTGVFVLVQAMPRDSAAWGAVYDRLVARARSFGGPVVIAHGDDHNQEVETPFLGLDNVTRWETGGGGGGTSEWIRADIDCTSPGIFSQVVVPTGSTPSLRLNSGATAGSGAERGGQFTIDP